MGKREENKTAKLLDREIINGIKEQLKGTGWKKKHNSFFREINDNFYYVTAQPIFKFDNGTPTITVLASSNAKPMGIDPIYWDIAEMPENKNEPLSFRAWAAFKTNALSFNHAKPLGHPTASVREVIDLFIEWKIEEIDRISKILKSRKFSDVFRELTNENIDKHSNPITLICTLILERCPEQALKIARQHASSSYQNLFVDGNSNDRVNFYVLTILYLAGRKAFEAERQIQLSKS